MLGFLYRIFLEKTVVTQLIQKFSAIKKPQNSLPCSLSSQQFDLIPRRLTTLLPACLTPSSMLAIRLCLGIATIMSIRRIGRGNSINVGLHKRVFIMSMADFWIVTVCSVACGWTLKMEVTLSFEMLVTTYKTIRSENLGSQKRDVICNRNAFAMNAWTSSVRPLGQIRLL
jgi:hypothetical protein